jgi:hypothetical protein
MGVMQLWVRIGLEGAGVTRGGGGKRGGISKFACKGNIPSSV